MISSGWVTLIACGLMIFFGLVTSNVYDLDVDRRTPRKVFGWVTLMNVVDLGIVMNVFDLEIVMNVVGLVIVTIVCG